MDIKDYVKERDEALTESIKKDSVEPFKAFLIKNNVNIPNDKFLPIFVRKAAIHSQNVEPLYKGLAVNWLLDRGYDLNLKEV